MKYAPRMMFAAYLAIGGAACLAQAVDAASDQPAATISDTDRDFVRKAAIRTLAGVEHDKAGEQKGASRRR